MDEAGTPAQIAGTGDLPQRFEAVVNGALKAFRAAKRTDLVREVAAEAKRPASKKPIVVVAGESKRGKSSIVNALAHHLGLSPTGPEVTTSAYIVLSHGDHLAATVAVRADLEVSHRQIDLEDIGEWASSDGNPDNVKQVLAVDVTLDAPFLSSLTLVDTPGVGGLESPHGAISVPMARQADAIIFVLDANAPLSAPELAFLYEVSARVDAIFIVVGKVDDYPGWTPILESNQGLLTRYAPTLAGSPIFPVSARLAEVGLMEESGLPELEHMLRARVVARAHQLRACNTLVTVRDGLQIVGELATAELAASQGDPDLRALMETERARLEGFQRESSTWQRKLGNEVQHIRVDHGQQLGSALAALQLRYFQAVDDKKPSEHDAIADGLVEEIEALARSLSERAGLRLTNLVTELMGDVDGDVKLGTALATASTAALGNGTIRVERPGGTHLTKVDKLSSVVSFSSGKSIAGIATSLPLIGAFGLPVVGVGLGAGALFSFLAAGSKKELNTKAGFKTWIQSQISEAQKQVSADFTHRMIDVQEDLREPLVAYIDRRRGELDRAINEYDKVAKQSESLGAASRRAAEAKVAAIRGLLQETNHLLACLGSLRCAQIGS